MRIAVLGLGNVGLAFVKALAEDSINLEFVRFCDASCERLEMARGILGFGEAIQSDLSSVDGIAKCVEGVDVVIDALPSRLSPSVFRVCGSRCVDVLSVSFVAEDPFRYHELFERCGRRLVVDAGIAPGLSNIIAANIVSQLDVVDELGIYVGGLPSEPVGVLNYVVTWSAEDLIEEYVRKARILRNGSVTEVDPLEDVEIIEIPGMGRFEAFYSDGLRTMLKTLTGKVRNMYEKTIRWPGHLEKIKLLRDLGFFDSEPIEVGGVKVVPKIFTARILEKRLKGFARDFVLMYIVGQGVRSGVAKTIRYLVKVGFDEERGLSAMSKATGFTAYAVFREVFIKGRVGAYGVVPPEVLGFDENTFSDVISYLRSKGVEVREFVE